MSMSSSSSDFDNLFHLTCSFDPLKSMLKKMADKQNELSIEIKLINDKLGLKADK